MTEGAEGWARELDNKIIIPNEAAQSALTVFRSLLNQVEKCYKFNNGTLKGNSWHLGRFHSALFQ